MFGTKKTLIVVYKDELLMNQLKKMVETHDDGEEGAVGTTDDSISIVSWTEKVWLGNKKAGNIQGKILFLDDIKGTDKLIPVLDTKFDKFGVKFGWAGNQAVLYIEPKELIDRKNYDAFLAELNNLPVPGFMKSTKPVTETSVQEIGDLMGDEDSKMLSEEGEIIKRKQSRFFKAAQRAIVGGAETVGKVGKDVALKSEELFRNKNRMKRQMLFYGVIHLYNDGLETFMNQ